MAHYIKEVSRTFGEYLLIPSLTTKECTPDNVSLKTPVVKFRQGETSKIQLNIPFVSAVMQAVSDDKMAVALAKEGGISFIFGSQPIASQAAMVARAKSYKAGFVISDSNISPESTLNDILALKARTGHSTVAVTTDGTAQGKLVGLVTSRDYRVSRMEGTEQVKDFMTPMDQLIWAPSGTTLKEANNIIWDNKINQLPIVDAEGRLEYMVFRKDYDSHKVNKDELLDSSKRYVVGAGINTRDFKERVPALVEAGVDILCIDSSEGYSEWQKDTLEWIRETYGDTVKVGAGNVVDAEGFRFLAKAGADFVKIGIGGGSPMDSSKAIATMAAHPEQGTDPLWNPENKALPVVAVPTTAGTGSEVTQYAIVTLHAKRTKSSIAAHIFATVAFLDPKYMDTLPARTTNNTAVDALTHLVESYLCRKGNRGQQRNRQAGAAAFQGMYACPA